MYSVFVDPAGEWKLGAVEYVHAYGSDPVARLSSLGRYDPPEGKTSRRKETWYVDFSNYCQASFNFRSY